jgi:3-dehydroquinate synthase
MSVLPVGLGARSYTITIEPGCLGKIAATLKSDHPASHYCIVSDDTVAGLYGKRLLGDLRGQGLAADLLSFPHGEAHKNIATVAQLASGAAQLGLDRKSMIIALGGGVSGDIAGFLASAYMRGIPFVQAPTSLLAQVDSSVGGKTGVDIPEGKNLFGSFYQPRAVFIDPEVLRTLPEEQYLNGLAEVIKHGVIRDADYFGFMDDRFEDIMALDGSALQDLIFRSCQIKAEVVAEDETETNIRRILNFGHTIGHAVEAASEFSILHGFAVSIGMLAAARIAEMKSMLDAAGIARLTDLLKRYKLPTEIPPAIDRERIRAYLLTDKKRIGGITSFILPEAIGRVTITDDVTTEQINRALASRDSGA